MNATLNLNEGQISEAIAQWLARHNWDTESVTLSLGRAELGQVCPIVATATVKPKSNVSSYEYSDK